MLTSRQLLIFKAIVDEFVLTAEPVGSKTLMDKYQLDYSSATIRNEMMALEDFGLLEKTHTSSGRVPSVSGYRFYVEHLLTKDPQNEFELQIANQFNINLDLNEAIKKSCDILSQMTSLTSLVLGPDATKQRLEHIKLFRISDRSAVAVIITDKGHTENKVFQFEFDVSLEDLETCTQILNDRLRGTLICDIVDKMEVIRPIMADSVQRYEALFSAFLNAFIRFASDNVYCSGKNNMLYQPEFADLERLRGMMAMLENSTWLQQLQQSNSTMMKMNDHTDLFWYDDMAVISSKFHVSANEMGEMIVIGPSRMQYNRIVSLMDALTKTMEKLYGKR
jgi:heat-inducible transcriptional repressor